ncbi:hypothetical protein [Lewinella sp. 4G2]|uniref:hypothetical protein n=1 Tax=Lewinella sp. 4G2 TaxID=1803372 RepID=UPI0007B46DFB|nr:hypothetical protein [Lewinella sp. 4G2]OAV43648.1 hypothetical protein A3850_003665 [Lewinella sp. 4G2]
MRKHLLLCLGLLFATCLTAGEHHYTFTEEAQRIYTDIFALELDRAATDIVTFRQANPTNLVAEHLESYLDFFHLYLSGDEGMDARLEDRFDRRYDVLSQGSETDPFTKYALAENYLHRSLIELRFERHLSAFRNLNRANKLLRANAKDFPDFLPNYKDLGLLHAAVGSIPPSYKWGVELFSSLNGEIAEGRAEIQRALLDTESPFYLETAVVAAFVELHLAGDADGAYEMVQRLPLQPARNGLHCFVSANLAMHSGRNDEALRLLEAQPRGGTATDFPYLDFMLGLSKLRSLDPVARIHFQSFINRYAGRHFKEEARQKIAWAYLLKGDEEAYRRSILEIGGGSRAGGDEHAAREAAGDRPPHAGLLRSRLLFDGNYGTRASAQLDQIEFGTLNKDEQLEYLYRRGRVAEALEQYDDALTYYAQTVALGRDHPAYFACKSALQAGMVEETRGNRTAAAAHFRVCLSISPSEYKVGLHTLANAGLNRVE